MNKLIISHKKSLIDSMNKFENNHKGYLLVCNDNEELVGVLTDGDVRRAILKGAHLNSIVGDICNKNTISILFSEGFYKILELFLEKEVLFLPVINNDKKIVNVITKEQFYNVALSSKKINLLDKLPDCTEFEIAVKPWGFYKTIAITQHSQIKLLHVFPGRQLSLQEHQKREEYWVIVKGSAHVTLGASIKHVNEGAYIFVPKGCKHRLKNLSNKEDLIVSEIQLGEYFGEDDLIRYEDDYNRIKEK
jgi:mannose-1-phosphate guanylyltransferase / mannose-6-phosphate isomerase